MPPRNRRESGPSKRFFILQRVQTGTEVIIVRDAQPVFVLRPIHPVHRNIGIFGIGLPPRLARTPA
jgi:hypothetical protein